MFMQHMTKKTNGVKARVTPTLALIRSHIATSMIGQAVDLMVEAGKTAHGVVTGIQLENGETEIVVAGSNYKLDQVLTVTPAILN
jgi:hypothetical protein